MQALIRLVGRGLAQIFALTLSDANHVLGYKDYWHSHAAMKALKLFGRRKNGSGGILAEYANTMAEMILDQLNHYTWTALPEISLSEQSKHLTETPKILATHTLMHAGLVLDKGLVRIETGLYISVFGIVASSCHYYPAVGERLNCRVAVSKRPVLPT